MIIFSIMVDNEVKNEKKELLFSYATEKMLNYTVISLSAYLIAYVNV